MKLRFFATAAHWRRWLARNHKTTKILWVGFYRRASGRPSITWPESVDEALCFGWIDGLRKTVDEVSYAIRFTPRRPDSIWSDVNTARVAELTRSRRMRAAGLRAFAARLAHKAGVYGYEQRRTAKLTRADERVFRVNAAAWEFFKAQAPYYQRITSFYVISAKRPETRARRLARLIADSARGLRIGLLRNTRKV
jgi:uncharacterized protein YdeI (YjbR/CyaY-like superfamily)